jgi:(4S)-4-hydroxy-5-phosphonooxypentane-2,3-dione isomerase
VRYCQSSTRPDRDLLTVIAHYRPQPGEGDNVAAILAMQAAPTRAEPGCVRFVVNRCNADLDRFVLYEKYADEAAFEARRQTSHFREYIEQAVVPLLVEREWQRYTVNEPD